MATRTVTSVLKRPDGTAWSGAVVRFQPLPDEYRTSPDETYPGTILSAVTDSTGALAVSLISGPAMVYRVTMPDRNTFQITVLDGSTTTLEALR